MKKKFNRTTENHNDSWYKLDNAGKIYPAIVSKRLTTLFRVSVTLKKPVKITILQKALDKIILRTPYFKVELKRGFFWYYFETNKRMPQIEQDSKYPCMNMRIKNRGLFLFRIRAFKNRIAAEFSHSLTDGIGALVFLKSITAEYFKLQGVPQNNRNDLLSAGDIPDPNEYEDGFKKNYSQNIPAPERTKKAFHLPYSRCKYGVYHITTGIVPIEAIRKESKELRVSITEFLLALYFDTFQDILNSYPKKLKRKILNPVRIMVPVNLRKIYPLSFKTMRNFFLTVGPSIDFRLGYYSFTEIINKVHHFMSVEVNEKYINQQISRNIKGETHPIVRILPLFLKNLILPIIYRTIGQDPITSSFSNLGIVTMPPEIEKKIERFEFIPPPSRINPVHCSVVSFKENVYITFGRVIKMTIVEKTFFRKLIRMGIPVKIESNLE